MELILHFHRVERPNQSHSDYFESKTKILKENGVTFTVEPLKPFNIPYEIGNYSENVMFFPFEGQNYVRIWEFDVIITVIGTDCYDQLMEVVGWFDDYVCYEINEIVFK